MHVDCTACQPAATSTKIAWRRCNLLSVDQQEVRPINLRHLTVPTRSGRTRKEACARAMPAPTTQSGSRLRQRADCSCPTRSLDWIEREKPCGIKPRAHAALRTGFVRIARTQTMRAIAVGCGCVANSARLHPECASTESGSQGSTRTLHPDPVSIGCARPPATHRSVSDTCTRLGRARETVRNQITRRTAPVRRSRADLASGSSALRNRRAETDEEQPTKRIEDSIGRVAPRKLDPGRV